MLASVDAKSWQELGADVDEAGWCSRWSVVLCMVKGGREGRWPWQVLNWLITWCKDGGAVELGERGSGWRRGGRSRKGSGL